MLRLDLPRHPLQILEELLEPARQRRHVRRTIPLEVLGTDDRVTLSAMLPGLAPDSIDVSLDHRELRIRADRRPTVPASDPAAEAGEPTARVLSSELDHAPVDLRLRLGFRPDTAAMQATYELGVLRIDVPRAAEERPIRIPVNTR